MFPFSAVVWSGMDIVSSLNPDEYVPYHWGLHVGMLYVLLGLHVYWYALFLFMGYKYLKTGVTQDIQQETSKELLDADQFQNRESRYRGNSKRRRTRGQ